MFNFFKKNVKSNPEVEAMHHQRIQEDFSNIDPIAQFFKSETGITFENQKSILKSKLISFCKKHHIHSFQKCLQQIQTHSHLKQELINYLTTNESYFYREFDQIVNLVQHVKNTLHSVDILCAPSSTGEEVYSIAIALLEADISENRFNIIGIDINTDALEHARSGVYNKRNISKLPSHLLKKYFLEKNSKYYLAEKIKRCVNLQSQNIFSSSFKNIGRFDYIFSRNMLIYFDSDTKIKAREILEHLLKDQSKPIYFGHADLF